MRYIYIYTQSIPYIMSQHGTGMTLDTHTHSGHVTLANAQSSKAFILGAQGGAPFS